MNHLTTFRQQQTAKLREKCRELCQAGKSITEIAETLGVVVSTVHNHTRDLKRTRKTFSGRKERVNNPWLDPEDEANVQQFYVPPPEEIIRLKAVLRAKREADDKAREPRI